MIVVNTFHGRGFLAALLAAGLLLAGADGALAERGGDRQEGGGTWGSVLQISGQAEGPGASFTVSRKDGRPFSMESGVTIRTGSYTGPAVASGTITSGSRSAVLNADLQQAGQGDQVFYAYLANSYGYAWAGPVRLAGWERVESSEEEYADPGDDRVQQHWPPADYGKKHSSPLPPYIDSWPNEAELCREVLIGVTAQAPACWKPGLVRIECKAEDDGRPFSKRLRPGEKTHLPFKFSSAGTKTICCRTVDDCGRYSSWTRRTIRVKECNRGPAPPVISLKPCDACVRRPVRISVKPGADPDGDQVQVLCRAEDVHGNPAQGSPYSSGWQSVPYPAVPEFTFNAVGKGQIACYTRDSKGARSEAVRRFIDILACKKPCKDGSCRARTETKISISVISEAGSGGDRVQVRREGDDDEPRPVSYDKPYLPDEQDQAEQDEEVVNIPLRPEDGDARIQQDDIGP